MTAAAALIVGGCPTPSNDSTCTSATPWTQTDITTNVTIPAGCYTVGATIRVHDGGTLTISPGVTLQFAAGLGLFLEEDGALTAVGTATNPILLTARSKSPGAWVGLRFDSSNSPQNQLGYVTVQYGGSPSGSDAADFVVIGSSRVAVSNCTFADSSTLGFVLRNALSAVPEITFMNNTVTRNRTGAGQVEAQQVGFLDATTQFSGNDVDLLFVGGGDTNVDQNWAAIDVSYRVQGSIRVNSRMQVAPGAVLEFGPGRGLFVQNTGSLTAAGTEAQPILLTSQTKAPGAWVGVRFASLSPLNRLEHATVEFGGASSGGLAANVLVDLNSAAVVDTCVIRQSASFGIEQRRSGTLTQTNNTFAGNSSTDVQIDP